MKEDFPEVISAALVQYPRTGVFSLTYDEGKLFEEEEGIAFVDSELCALNVHQGYKINSSLKMDNVVVEMKEC